MHIYRVLNDDLPAVAGRPVTADRIVMLTPEQAKEPLAQGVIDGPFDSFPMRTGIKERAPAEPRRSVRK